MPGHQGPPPWVAGLFGLTRGDERRGPRVRRGDVRAAILDVLRTNEEKGEAADSINGYQIIGTIADRSGGAWRPSPGSVYPTISQLEDEGLVVTGDELGRRTLTLTDAGRAYVTVSAEELAAVWAPFDRQSESQKSQQRSDYADLKPEIGQVMGAVWQLVTQGSESQRRAAVDVLVDTRRRLYGILADGDDAESEEAAEA
jgi:DNA-binding PadR family transcriptional regulator